MTSGISLCFTILLTLPFSSGLRCYTCFEALDHTLCRDVETCVDEAKCSFMSKQGPYGVHYHLGCTSETVCQANQMPPLFGRRKREVSTPQTLKCCDTDLCNMNFEPVEKSSTSSALTSSTPTTSTFTTTTVNPTTLTTAATTKNIDTTIETTTQTTTKKNRCVDHQNCDYFVYHAPTCSDNFVAYYVCPQSCNTCSHLTDCHDVNPDCQELDDHLSICTSDPPYAYRICRRHCQMCGMPVPTTAVTTTSVPTTAATTTTHIPITAATTTGIPTTAATTTSIRTTEASTTSIPTTEATTTSIPTTAATTTSIPTTAATTTSIPTTEAATTSIPTTAATTTSIPTTAATTTSIPTTAATTTLVHTTLATTTFVPSTEATTTSEIKTASMIAGTASTTTVPLSTTPSTTMQTSAIPTTKRTSCGDPQYCLVILDNGYSICSNIDTAQICPNMCAGCPPTTSTGQSSNLPLNNTLGNSATTSNIASSQPSTCSDPEFCIPILNNQFNLCNTEQTASLCPRACGQCTPTSLEGLPSTTPSGPVGIIIG